MIAEIPKGDLVQLKELSSTYNALLETKNEFISKAVREQMNPHQRAEAELTLAMISGELKRVDGLIHFLMFGGEMPANEICQPLYWHARKELEKEIDFAQPVRIMEQQQKRPYNERRHWYLEIKAKEQDSKIKSLNNKIWQLQQKLKVGNVFYSVPGPLTITVPKDHNQF